MEYQALSEQLVKDALALGAEAAEVYIEAGRELSIEIRNGDIETVQESSTHGAGCRVFIRNRMAFASSNDFSESALKNIITGAVRMARVTTADENNVLPDDPAFTKVEGLYDPSMAGIPLEKKIGLAKGLEKLAMKDSRITKSAGAGYSEGESDIFIANSNGLSKSYKAGACSMGVSVVAEKGDQKCSGSEYCTRRFFGDFEPVRDIAEKAAKDAYEMLDPGMVKTQKAAAVFDPDVAGSIFSGVLAAVNGERVLQGASFLGDKLKEKIASDIVTLIDDGTRPRGMASKPFDGEGVPTQKRIIVDRGILQGFMYNCRVAKRAGVRSTGNAVRGGFTSLPDIGCHNFYLAAGVLSPEEILRETARGLYIKEITGYGINPVNGSFSGGVEGFWIENGRLAFPVKGLTIAGSAFEMLQGIDLVGNDLDLNRSFTAPTFRIREMQIGGE